MHVSAGSSAKLYKRFNHQVTGSKQVRKRTVRYGLVIANLALVLITIGFVSGSGNNANVTQNLAAGSAIANSDNAQVGPLDELSSVDVAVNIARSVTMPEAVAVTNQSDSAKVNTEITSADTAVVAKPQVIATDVKSNSDTQTYISQLGDTVASIAAKFNVTSDSIRWSNNLTGDSIRSGTQLTIPPVNGIAYTVAEGDTPDSLAARFKANKDEIIAFNDAELNGLKPGQKVIIPNGQQAAPARAAYSSYTAPSSGGFGAFTATYGFNGYDRGWCTWYVANRVNMPTNWGNANTWDDRARLSGWTVSNKPRVGAIAQSNVGWAGHVGVVEAVSEDGSMIKYSDMNGLAGFNRVGNSSWVPANAKYQNFIYR